MSETQKCRDCGTDVTITRIDGQVQETSGDGLVRCDDCHEAYEAR